MCDQTGRCKWGKCEVKEGYQKRKLIILFLMREKKKGGWIYQIKVLGL